MAQNKGFSGKYGVGLLSMNAFLRTVGLASGKSKIAVRIDAAFKKHGRPRPTDVPLSVYCGQQKAFILETAKGHYKSNARFADQTTPSSQVAPAYRPYAGDVNSDAFLSSFAWRQLRMQVLQKYGRVCMCCGASPATGAVMHVDHIKPRRLFPQLALDIDNLQVLCHECNHGKGNWDQTDWRPHDDKIDPEVSAWIRSIAREPD